MRWRRFFGTYSDRMGWKDDPFAPDRRHDHAGIAVWCTTQGYILRSEYPHALHIYKWKRLAKAVAANLLWGLDDVVWFWSSVSLRSAVVQRRLMYVAKETFIYLEKLGRQNVVWCAFKNHHYLQIGRPLFGKTNGLFNNVIKLKANHSYYLDKGCAYYCWFTYGFVSRAHLPIQLGG